MREEQLVETARELSQSISPGDLDHTLNRITAAAVKVLPEVTHASITVRHADGSLQTVAPTDAALCALDGAQYDLEEGPCFLSVDTTEDVIAPHLATDERFPRYRGVAAAAGIQAQAAVGLYDTPRTRGALNLYSEHPGAFSDLGSLGELFARQSSMAIEYAQEIENLKEVLSTRTTIGQAVGIVMERYGFGDERAFAFLARLSHSQDIGLRAVAQAIVEASEERSH